MDQSTQPVNSGTPQPTNQAQPAAQKTDVLGIISIIFAFIGLQVIGFILGLVGVKKAKEEGRPTTLSKVGWILNLVIMILAIIVIIIFVIIGAAASKNPDVQDAARNLESSLEESTDSTPNAGLVAAYDKINEGMSKADAEKELNTSSTSCTSSSYGSVGSFETCSYGGFSDKVSISLTYQDGVVKSKSKSEY